MATNGNLPPGMNEIPILVDVAEEPIDEAIVTEKTIILTNVGLEKFNGSKLVSVKEWLDSCRDVADANGWSSVQLMRHLPVSLVGAARNWYLHRIKSIGKFGTFETFKAEIETAFGPSNESRQKHTALRLREQSVGEPVANYYHDKMHLCAEYNDQMPDKEKVDHILAGLQDEFTQAVHDKDFATPESLLAALKRKEDAMERRPKVASVHVSECAAVQQQHPEQSRMQQQQVNGRQPRHDKPCYECQKVGHFARDCFTRKRRLEREARERNQDRGNTTPKNQFQGERRY